MNSSVSLSKLNKAFWMITQEDPDVTSRLRISYHIRLYGNSRYLEMGTENTVYTKMILGEYHA